MKESIWEYIELTTDEKKKLWDNCVFVFDANVLLNLYRYSKTTSDALLVAFEKLSPRIWIPHQVAYEFMKNRCSVIYEVSQAYDKFDQDTLDFIEKAKKLANLGSKDADVEALSKLISTWVKECKKKNVRVTDPHNDSVLKKLLVLFEGKTGVRFDSAKREEVVKESDKRFSRGVPPGYKDEKKGNKEGLENNKHGDYFIWRQLMDYANEQHKNIIFITDDQKEDWWLITKGKTIGPLPELMYEFHEITNQSFFMYSMDSFLRYFENQIPGISQGTIDEVNRLSSNVIDSRRQRSIEISELEARRSRIQQTLVLDRERLINFMEEQNNTCELSEEEKEHRLTVLRGILMRHQGLLASIDYEISQKSALKNSSIQEERMF